MKFAFSNSLFFCVIAAVVVALCNIKIFQKRVELGVLTDDERSLFQEYQEEHQLHKILPRRATTKKKAVAAGNSKAALHIKKGQVLGSCGGSISCVDIATIRQNQARLADIPPCYTPESCEQLAQSAGYFPQSRSANSTNSSVELPIFDRDGAELIGAMQKQDKMILEVKEAKELRARQGDKAPPLKPIVCGSECFKRKGVWCCRRNW
jgi:hypothetical protein